MSSPSSGGGGRRRERSAPHRSGGGGRRRELSAPHRSGPRQRERIWYLPSDEELDRYSRPRVIDVEDMDGNPVQLDLSDDEFLHLERSLVLFGSDEDIEDEEGPSSGTAVRNRARVPASSEAIQALQEVAAGDAGVPTECAVCLQDFAADDELRAMPCAHAFHQNCIFGWLQRNGVCPLCRYALPAQQPEDEDDYWRPSEIDIQHGR